MWRARIRSIYGAYVSEGEIDEIVDFVKKNQGEPKFLEEITKSADEKSGADGIEYLDDPKYDGAVRVVLSTGQASASYLLRRLKLGYSRAARLIKSWKRTAWSARRRAPSRDILIRADDYRRQRPDDLGSPPSRRQRTRREPCRPSYPLRWTRSSGTPPVVHMYTAV